MTVYRIRGRWFNGKPFHVADEPTLAAALITAKKWLQIYKAVKYLHVYRVTTTTKRIRTVHQ